MAKLSASTGIGKYSAGYYLQQKGIYYANYVDSAANNYLHFKTNVGKQTSIMLMIEAIGYNYGVGKPVRCAWSFYTYGGSNDPIAIGLSNVYTGLVAHGVYYSSDNYTCLRAYNSAGIYYCGITIDVYATGGAGIGYPVSILASAQNTTAGNYY